MFGMRAAARVVVLQYSYDQETPLCKLKCSCPANVSIDYLWKKKKKHETKFIASLLKQDPNTLEVQNDAIY